MSDADAYTIEIMGAEIVRLRRELDAVYLSDVGT